MITFWPTIQSVTAMPSSSPAGSIVSAGQWSVAVADVVYNGGNVVLPTGSDVGDFVEVHNNFVNFNTNATVMAPSGETFPQGVSSIPAPCLCRKISSSVWSKV